MGFWEVAGLIVGGFITLVSALKSGRESVRWLWRAFGWHGRFWQWLVRAVGAVDVVLSIPERLVTTEELLAEHIRVSKPQVALLNQMAADLGVTLTVVEDVRAEVKNNGGGSLKDSAHRIEAALGLPTPKKTPTGPVPVARPRRTRKPPEESA